MAGIYDPKTGNIMSNEQLMEIYQKLYKRYGPQHWWPGEGAFEIMIGAILTQNTNWGNVEKAIANLRSAGCMDPASLHRMDVSALAELIRPAGYYNLKAARLRNFLSWLFDNFDGDIERIAGWDTSLLRQELLGVKGIGKETADSILLYALDRPVFVVDTYTCRIMGRHGFIEPGADYEQVRDLFESSLPMDTELFNEYHALLVCAGKDYCKPKPKCDDCPLCSLPHDIDPIAY